MSTTFESGITSWREQSQFRSMPLGDNRTIATEYPLDADPCWAACFAALQRLLHESAKLPRHDSNPNPMSIRAALAWVRKLSEKSANWLPAPVLIVPEPGGGIIVEWRETASAKGRSFDFTFYNDGNAEVTLYDRGVLTKMVEIPMFPSA